MCVCACEVRSTFLKEGGVLHIFYEEIAKILFCNNLHGFDESSNRKRAVKQTTMCIHVRTVSSGDAAFDCVVLRLQSSQSTCGPHQLRPPKAFLADCKFVRNQVDNHEA